MNVLRNTTACDPVKAMEEVRAFFHKMTNSQILEYALGVENPSAPPLAASTIVVVMDCEKFVYPPQVLTEFGLHTFSRKEMVPEFQKGLDFHAENLLKKIYYRHIRILENAHYVNRRICAGNPENNRFGSTRFVKKQEATKFLARCFGRPVDPNQPNGLKCPVVFLGHAVENEREMLQADLGVDPATFNNVVAIIDTQTIAKEQGYSMPGQLVGLESLAGQFFLELRDAHTASNDAGYTIISAVQMVMEIRLPPDSDGDISIEEVVDNLEQQTKDIDPGVGIAKYRTRCAKVGHVRKNCFTHVKPCGKCLQAGAEKASKTHVIEVCTRL